MGASQSISGHFTHREGWRHRLKLVASNEVREPCRMCAQRTELGKKVYRCSSCAFILHDACYLLPEERTHFAHSCKGGRHLTLTDGRTVPSGRSCGICAAPLDGSFFVYGCGKCHGFYAHPRCCDLPQTLHNPLHEDHPLTLLSPPQPARAKNDNNGWGRARSCLNKAGKCSNASKRLESVAMSYQCNVCYVELCLACQLPGGGDDDTAAQQHGDGRNDYCFEDMVAYGQVVADAMGAILHSFCCALCLGGQGAPSATMTLPTYIIHK